MARRGNHDREPPGFGSSGERFGEEWDARGNEEGDEPGEADRELIEDEEVRTVRCSACGKYVRATAHQCHRCGHEFDGEAWQEAIAEKGLWWFRTPRFITFVALLLVLLIVLAMFSGLW